MELTTHLAFMPPSGHHLHKTFVLLHFTTLVTESNLARPWKYFDLTFHHTALLIIIAKLKLPGSNQYRNLSALLQSAIIISSYSYESLSFSNRTIFKRKLKRSLWVPTRDVHSLWVNQEKKPPQNAYIALFRASESWIKFPYLIPLSKDRVLK